MRRQCSAARGASGQGWCGAAADALCTHRLPLRQTHPASPLCFLPPPPCSVEDIQGLMLLAPKGCKPKPALMATFFAKLTQIFTKSESRLYSAYAWYR